MWSVDSILSLILKLIDKIKNTTFKTQEIRKYIFKKKIKQSNQLYKHTNLFSRELPNANTQNLKYLNNKWVSIKIRKIIFNCTTVIQSALLTSVRQFKYETSEFVLISPALIFWRKISKIIKHGMSSVNNDKATQYV